jgi:hypothetical protein
MVGKLRNPEVFLLSGAVEKQPNGRRREDKASKAEKIPGKVMKIGMNKAMVVRKTM